MPFRHLVISCFNYAPSKDSYSPIVWISFCVRIGSVCDFFTISCGFWEVKVFKTLCHVLLASWIQSPKNVSISSLRATWWGNVLRLVRPVTVNANKPSKNMNKNDSYRKFAGLKWFLHNVTSEKNGGDLFPFQSIRRILTNWSFVVVLFHLYFISVVNQSGTTYALKRTLHTELSVKCV